MRDDCARADDDVSADGHARAYRDVAADPHIVADGDRIGVFQPFVAALDVQRVPGGVEAAVRRDEHIVAELHLGTVEDDCVVVG